ncbi:MAG: UPF0280 family protein [Spirochaetes bacterium]|nr:UPF0280 family protein [Spirochaetota bacterium]
MRSFQYFQYREACLNISTTHLEIVKATIVKQRQLLDKYIEAHPEFQLSLKPVRLPAHAPLIAQRMHEASLLTGLGPMASVAGIFAQIACDEAVKQGANECIIDNGGDLFLYSQEKVIVAIFPGNQFITTQLAFEVHPEELPLAICSSSGIMGHSQSFGKCDLATVVAKDAALADSAATYCGNLIQDPDDINQALERIMKISGILGVLAIKADKIGMAGHLPRLIRVSE